MSQAAKAVHVGDTGHLEAPRFAGRRSSATDDERRGVWHRHLPPLGSAIIVVVVAILSGWLVSDLNTSTFVDHRYAAGQTLRMNDYTVAVRDVTAAQTVDEVSTSGVFVVASVVMVNTGNENVSAGKIAVRDRDGVTYTEGTGLNVGLLEPGFSAAFEVPIVVDPARLEGLQLVADEGGFNRVRDRRAFLDLGIDAARAQELRALANGRTMQLREPAYEATK